MNPTETMVLQALKDKAPSLHQQLSEAGTLRKFVTERADEIEEATSDLTMRIASKKGAFREPFPSPMEKVGILNQAQSLARERVFAEMLEFPQDEISQPSQDETTASAMAT